MAADTRPVAAADRPPSPEPPTPEAPRPEPPTPDLELDSPHVEVRRSSRRRRTVTAYRERDTIVVLIPERMSKADEAAMVTDMVRKVLAREARTASPRGDAELAERAAGLAQTYLAPLLGEAPRPRSITWVTNQQHRWGSCTPSTGMIRLSHRLQPMPSWVVDYVIIHELAHLVEPSHSAAFWRLVNVYPDQQRAQGYLEGFLAARRISGGTDQHQPDVDG